MMNVGVEPQFSIKMYSKILNSFTAFQRSITNRVDKGYFGFFTTISHNFALSGIQI
jgi:hypothetical protein